MKFFNQVLLNNTIESYLIVAGIIVLALFIKRIVTKYATKLLFRVCSSKWREASKEEFDEYILIPVERFFLIIVIFLALGSLNFPKLFMFTLWGISLHTLIQSLAAGIFIISLVSVIVRFLDYLVITLKRKASNRTAGENQLLFFLKDFIKVIIIIFGIVFVLKFTFGFDVSKLLTGLSIVGAALALAARESLENLIASFVIFFDKPFITGDIVKVKEFVGTVNRIGLRSTRITTFNGTVVAVPNKQMVDNILDNWSERNYVQNELKVLLPAKASAERLQKAIDDIQKVANLQNEVHSTMVYLQEITADNAVIMVNYFTPLRFTLPELNILRQQLNLAIKKIQEQISAELAA